MGGSLVDGKGMKFGLILDMGFEVRGLSLRRMPYIAIML